MRYGDLLRHAWGLVRGSRAIIGLAGLRMLAAAAMGTLALAVTLPALAVVVVGQVQAAGVQSGASIPGEVMDALEFAYENWSLFVAVLVVLTLIAVASGVFDVAAYGGLVTVTASADRGQLTSVRRGLRAGFAKWWRTAALYAILWLPSLVMMAGYALLFVPVARLGPSPESTAMFSASISVASPLLSLLSFAALPVGILVELAMRFGLLADFEWRDSVRAAWGLMRSRPAEVALTFLLFYAVMYAASFAAMMVATLALAAALAVAIGAYQAGAIAAALLVGVAAVGLVALAYFALCAVVMALQSAVWTVFWHETAGAGGRFVRRDPGLQAPAGGSVVAEPAP